MYVSVLFFLEVYYTAVPMLALGFQLCIGIVSNSYLKSFVLRDAKIVFALLFDS